MIAKHLAVELSCILPGPGYHAPPKEAPKTAPLPPVRKDRDPLSKRGRGGEQQNVNGVHLVAIAALLVKMGPMTVTEITLRYGVVTTNQVRAALNHLEDSGEVERLRKIGQSVVWAAKS